MNRFLQNDSRYTYLQKFSSLMHCFLETSILDSCQFSDLLDDRVNGIRLPASAKAFPFSTASTEAVLVLDAYRWLFARR